MLCAIVKSDAERSICQANRTADFIEISLADNALEKAKFLRALCRKPVIFKMQKIYWSYLELKPNYVDLPHTTPRSVFERIREKFPGIGRICSYHNFEKTPDLDSIALRLRALPAEFYKIATYARSLEDSLHMLNFVKKTHWIGLCMGEYGEVTRILSPLFGSPWTYAPFSEKEKTAPGQLLVEELIRVYRLKKISPQTALYGLIGDPVKQSLGHVIYNLAFKKLNLDAVYIKMRMSQKELPICFPLLKKIGFKGLSVTMPLKQAITSFVEEKSGESLNTINFQYGKILGSNTDGTGALDALEKKIVVADKRMVLLGAGGAAWGIALEAKKRGAELIIVNRTPSKAFKLAQTVNAKLFSLEEFKRVAELNYDILVNCTSVGMRGSQMPVATDDLLEGKFVMDIITTPRQTSLLKAAKIKGCVIIEGMEMYIQQAIGQFSNWFEKP
jgi:3-dehydroquinate dehydratase / shikimate dehydrogenase